MGVADTDEVGTVVRAGDMVAVDEDDMDDLLTCWLMMPCRWKESKRSIPRPDAIMMQFSSVPQNSHRLTRLHITF